MDSGEEVPVGEPTEGETDMDPELLAMLAALLGASYDHADAKNVSLGGKKFDVSSKDGRKAFEEAYKSMKAKMKDEAKGDSAELTEKLLLKQAKLDAQDESLADLRVQLKNAQAETEKVRADSAKEAGELTDLVVGAKKIAPEAKLDGLKTKSAIMRAVLLERAPKAQKADVEKKLDSGGDVYIKARYDMLSEGQAPAGEKRGDAADRTLRAIRGDGDEKKEPTRGENKADMETARADMIEKYRNKKPATKQV
jgi:hypothetical protein